MGNNYRSASKALEVLPVSNAGLIISIRGCVKVLFCIWFNIINFVNQDTLEKFNPIEWM